MKVSKIGEKELEQQLQEKLEKGKLEDAIKYLDSVLEINPENHEALYLHGKIMLKKKEFKKAEDKIQKAIDVQEKYNQPMRSGIHFHLG